MRRCEEEWQALRRYSPALQVHECRSAPGLMVRVNPLEVRGIQPTPLLLSRDVCDDLSDFEPHLERKKLPTTRARPRPLIPEVLTHKLEVRAGLRSQQS